MLIYNTRLGIVTAKKQGGPFNLYASSEWDQLFHSPASRKQLLEQTHYENILESDLYAEDNLLPPIDSQEVWAAGVTYYRSRTARMEESASAGTSSVYDKVYEAHRPELFFKATPHRVVGSGHSLSLRSDSSWMVPEPEVTLAFDSRGTFFGFTIGNDLSSRDIEGENPLYLPQAKVFNQCAALGPGLLLANEYPSADTTISISISRKGSGSGLFSGWTSIKEMKQSFANLKDHLFRDNSFPNGCYLMTGTGIVPPDGFTLQSGDRIEIDINAVGTLTNTII